MTAEEFLSAVFAPPYPRQQQEALLSILHGAHAAAQALPTSTERRQAHMAHIVGAKGLIEALMVPDFDVRVRQAASKAREAMASSGASASESPAMWELDDMGLLLHRFNLVQNGGNCFLSMVKKVRYQYRQRVHRRDFRDELCGGYPFRHADHERVHVLSASPVSEPSALGHRYPYAAVKPYTCARLSKRARASLYQERLAVRAITADDVKGRGEQSLIGQRGVFATKRIPVGTCIGVYGGQIVDRTDIFILKDDRYLINASDKVGQVAINGENIMSVMNTLYVIDDQGKPAGHPVTGYNVEPARFDVEMAYGWKLSIYAFFSTAEIQPGEELRWNYDSGRPN